MGGGGGGKLSGAKPSILRVLRDAVKIIIPCVIDRVSMHVLLVVGGLTHAFIHLMNEL